MKKTIAMVLLLGLAAMPLLAEKPSKERANATANTAAPVMEDNATSAQLESVLDELDKAAANFRSAQAEFVWEQYQKVVDETDKQVGTAFFVRHEKDTHMAATITEPEKKILLFTDGKIRFYQPKIEQVTEYDAGAKKEEVESFLVLGFGGRGHDLPKSFHIKFEGHEKIDGISVAKLNLVPKSDKVRNMFARIILWVDTARGVSLKQQAFEPSGDYRTAYYNNIKVNAKVPDDTFKLKTTNKTKFIRPQ